MADESQEERTEPASDKKRSEARRKGKVLKSVELNSAFTLVFGLLIVYFGGTAIATNLASVTRALFTASGTFVVNVPNVQQLFLESVVRLFLTVAPVVLGLMLVGVAAHVAQAGFVFAPEAIMPGPEKLNPLTGIRKIMVSRRSLVELLKNVVKVGIVAFAGYHAVEGVLEESVTLMDADAGAILGFVAGASLNVGLKTGLAFLVLAIADYFYQRFEFEKDLRMTRQEVKEEYRTMEGDPQIKGRIKDVQRKIAYRRMMHDVPTATVVVTNPTHVAVALKYEAGAMEAPRVVAKGADLLAQRIKDLARAHGVPVVEDRPLEIGHPIPEKLFQAVAQVLAYIYRMKQQRRPNGRS
jgi:flagellar biosynthetic protein FlhB